MAYQTHGQVMAVRSGAIGEENKMVSMESEDGLRGKGK